ncbi:conserved hypothetical protein [Nitrospira sp. ND1]|jgi:hypothetical protein|uniref:hypothetical protein n=1 Tax=Nitrospira sp. ND1 TaxID=1658518 RepID=UPI0009B932DE|nr:hypothetical protein [Nitrospira sp. ND1]SLM42864.1 conserved hypothetical protein [Nitrospira sp. ND1]
MTDDYAQRKVQVIREFLAARYPAPYTVEAVVPRRDPLADTKFKIILNNQVERTLAVCAAVVLDSLPTPDQLKQLLVSQGILEQVKASTDSRICHEALGTDEESHVRPMRSVRGT